MSTNSTSSPDDYEKFRVIGIVGLVLFATLASISLAGTIIYFRQLRRLTWNAKTLFFSLSLAFAPLQIPTFTELISNREELSCTVYGAHLIGGWVLLACFVAAILMWRGVVEVGPSRDTRFQRISVFAVGVLLVETVWVSIRCTRYGGNNNDYQQSLELRAHVWIMSISLLACSLGLLAAGLRIRTEILALHPSARSSGRLFRLVSALVLCCGLFAMRAAFLVILLVDYDWLAARISTVIVWYIVNNWLPTIVPFLVLIYLMLRNNNRDSRPSADQASCGSDNPLNEFMEDDSGPIRWSHRMSGAEGNIDADFT